MKIKYLVVTLLLATSLPGCDLGIYPTEITKDLAQRCVKMNEEGLNKNPDLAEWSYELFYSSHTDSGRSSMVTYSVEVTTKASGHSQYDERQHRLKCYLEGDGKDTMLGMSKNPTN